MSKIIAQVDIAASCELFSYCSKMNDKHGDPIQASHNGPFLMNPDCLKITQPFRMVSKFWFDKTLFDYKKLISANKWVHWFGENYND